MQWLALAGLVGAGAWAAGPVVREEARVKVDGVVERWRLEWRSAPELDCFEPEGVTCPCQGFAYAESGELEFVRSRLGAPDERLPLTPLFGGDPARLRRWKPLASDEELRPEQRLGVLARRESLRAMVLGDYDHDGQAREFVLQTAALACGLREAVLIGVDKRDGRARALGTVEHPERPLVLEPETWAKLLKAAEVESVETPCGDHGSEGEDVIRLRADARGLHATRERYRCTDSFARGAHVSSEVL